MCYSKPNNTGQGYRLEFENSYGEFILIGKFDTREEALKAMDEFLNKHKYKSYYDCVSIFPNGCERHDVGSYTEFFWINRKKSDEVSV